jgi:hypothetical protein
VILLLPRRDASVFHRECFHSVSSHVTTTSRKPQRLSARLAAWLLVRPAATPATQEHLTMQHCISDTATHCPWFCHRHVSYGRFAA